MDYWAITKDKCAETEMGKDSFLERKIFKISNALSTQVPGAKKIHKHTKKKKKKKKKKKELEISMFVNFAAIL